MEKEAHKFWDSFWKCESKAGCGQKNLYGTKKIVIPGNGLTVLEMRGNVCFNSIKIKSLICIRNLSWFQRETGLRVV